LTFTRKNTGSALDVVNTNGYVGRFREVATCAGVALPREQQAARPRMRRAGDDAIGGFLTIRKSSDRVFVRINGTRFGCANSTSTKRTEGPEPELQLNPALNQEETD
jgi:hypothetical protein